MFVVNHGGTLKRNSQGSNWRSDYGGKAVFCFGGPTWEPRIPNENPIKIPNPLFTNKPLRPGLLVSFIKDISMPTHALQPVLPFLFLFSSLFDPQYQAVPEKDPALGKLSECPW